MKGHSTCPGVCLVSLMALSGTPVIVPPGVLSCRDPRFIFCIVVTARKLEGCGDCTS